MADHVQDPDHLSHSDPHASSDGTLPDTESQTQPTQPPQQPQFTQPSDDTFHHDLDAEINHHDTNTTNNDSALPSDPMNMDGPSDQPALTTTSSQQQPQPHTNGPTTTATTTATTFPPAPALEPRIPQKKDATLRTFLAKTADDYAPLIPDAVTDYYLTLAGLPPPPQTDRRLARLLALATQKFIADIAADAYQYSRIRSTNTTSNNPLTGLGGAAGFGTNMGGPGGADGGEGGGSGAGGGKAGGGGGKKDGAAAAASSGKNAPLGGPRAGFSGGGAGGGQGRTVLTMEDLGMAVGEYGVNVKRGEFYR
ncbi:hypothetical protein LTR36_005384 [Oleoguttula mirabilis]|uniref:Transcription initiation factor TFIID subunit 10 n=1 Tax=Oleoguttula mirabilis TaxID=1507867 RepID=A0AAV9JE76_9PEZI|nr:hypothetical protein LTR36_005384 [Oleoguttula mirabilis]